MLASRIIDNIKAYVTETTHDSCTCNGPLNMSRCALATEHSVATDNTGELLYDRNKVSPLFPISTSNEQAEGSTWLARSTPRCVAMRASNRTVGKQYDEISVTVGTTSRYIY